MEKLCRRRWCMPTRHSCAPGASTPRAPVPPQPLLQCYAADLVRAPDGTWRVLADLVTNPAGIGHAHENRRLLARVMPEAFQPQAIRQLRPFFDLWQDALQRGSCRPAAAIPASPS